MLETRCLNTRNTFVICPTAPEDLFEDVLLFEGGFREGVVEGLRVAGVEEGGGGEVTAVARDVTDAEEGGGAVGVGEMPRDEGLMVALG